MRTALAHGLAILAMLPVLFVAFILMLGGGRLTGEAYGYAVVFMMFFGPVVLIATLVYYAIFRASNAAIGALALIGLALAAMLPFRFIVDILGLWLLIALAAVAAALTHHLVLRAVRGRATTPPAA